MSASKKRKSIIEEMRERRLKSLHASHRFQDHREQVAREQAERAKNVKNQTYLDEERMRELYYSSLRIYKQDKNITYAMALKGRSLSLWQRVVAKQKESGVDPEDFMKAQFEWTNRNFGTWPRISQLATDNAVIRAQNFKGLSGNVVASSIEVKSDLATTFATANKYLLQICRKQKMTREEVYRNLVLPGIITLPKEFLAADPAYQKVLDESD